MKDKRVCYLERCRCKKKNTHTFTEACLQEIASNGPECGSLKSLSWKKVDHVLKETYRFGVDRKWRTI